MTSHIECENLALGIEWQMANVRSLDRACEAIHHLLYVMVVCNNIDFLALPWPATHFIAEYTDPFLLHRARAFIH